MSKTGPNNTLAKVTAEKLSRSRQRLLDLTLRNRLLNFRPGNPQFHDDLKGHKHAVLKCRQSALWKSLVEAGQDIEITTVGDSRFKQPSQGLSQPRRTATETASDPYLPLLQIADSGSGIQMDSNTELSRYLQRGNAIAYLSEESFRPRFRKIRQEQSTLENSTGDSALFVALGFLEWTEPEPHPKAGVPLFAPLVLLHVNLIVDRADEDEGGERGLRLRMDADEQQGNPCLLQKLRQDFGIDLPVLKDSDPPEDYFKRITKAIANHSKWRVHDTTALGFFNFARYRLWLDLNPEEWPTGRGPADHPIVTSVINGTPLPHAVGLPSDLDVATHQEAQDLPLILDADSTQYAALLAANAGSSLVVQGPPGSGKSQTISNLIATTIAQGKTVLFVAQKLPALQVVRRRMDAVGLGPLCLPLFRETARATELHKHLQATAALRDEKASGKPLPGNAGSKARRLNGHAKRLKETPVGFSDSIATILERGGASLLELQEAWGQDWDEDVLGLSVPSSEPQAQWLEMREQTLLRWHQLKRDAGEGWTRWRPSMLGPMDTSDLDQAAKRIERAAKSLQDLMMNLPESFRNGPVKDVEQLAQKLRTGNFYGLHDVIQPLLNHLFSEPSAAAEVVALESTLTDYRRQLRKAELCWRIGHDDHAVLAESAKHALQALVSTVSFEFSLADAMAALRTARETLESAAELTSYSELYHLALNLLLPTIGSPPVGLSLNWKHVEILASHRRSDELSLPDGCRLPIARHLAERAENESDCSKLISHHADYICILEKLRARLSQVPTPVGSFDAEGTRAPLDALANEGLGTVPIAELPSLVGALEKLDAALSDTLKLITPHLSAALGSEGSFRIGALMSLALLSKLPSELLKPPPTQVAAVIVPSLAGIPRRAFYVAGFMEAIRSYEESRDGLDAWFPGLKITDLEPQSAVAVWHECLQSLRELRLTSAPVGVLPSLLDAVRNLRQAAEQVAECLDRLFKPWPIQKPSTFNELGITQSLLFHLQSIPFSTASISLPVLAHRVNFEMVQAACAEREKLTKSFRELEALVVVERVPKAQELRRLIQTLRGYCGRWWRWLSVPYRELRTELKAFLMPPLPEDARALELLVALETFDRERREFNNSPAVAFLSLPFEAKSSDWDSIQATLNWIGRLQAMVPAAEISELLITAQQPALIKESVGAIGRLDALMRGARAQLADLPVVSAALEAQNVPTISTLAGLLRKTETRLDQLLSAAKAQIEMHPEEPFERLHQHLDHVVRLHRSAQSLLKFSGLAAPSEALNFPSSELHQVAEWLSALEGLQLSDGVIDAICTGALQPGEAKSLALNSSKFVEAARLVSGCFPTEWAASLLADDEPCSELGTRIDSVLTKLKGCLNPTGHVPFRTGTTVMEALGSVNDLGRLAHAGAYLVEWKDLLGEPIESVDTNHIKSTVEWVKRLGLHGASGAFLLWLLENDTDHRLRWWQGMVTRCQRVRQHVGAINQKVALQSAGWDPNEPLNAWATRAAERNATARSCIERLETISQSSELSLQSLMEGVNALSTATRLQSELRPWDVMLGSRAETVEVDCLKNHRKWAATVKNLPGEIADWLLADEVQVKSDLLLSIDPQLSDLHDAVQVLRTGMEGFGRLMHPGPFEILSMVGGPAEILNRSAEFRSHLPSLASFAEFLREEESAIGLGLGKLVRHCSHPKCDAELLLKTFRGILAHQQAKLIWSSHPELRDFKVSEHEGLRLAFQESDQGQLFLNRAKVRQKVASRELTEGHRGKTVSEHSEYALLLHEMGKKKGHLPIRSLVTRAGTALRELCPCWMMTPLAVAQFLPPGRISFDLIIMDEASQINPEDAWGAITRGKQLIVVGDEKQMPPSDFFTSTLEEDELEDEHEDIDGGKSDSILDASMPSLMTSPLLWHYRSLHESLIAPANAFSYGGRLILFPHAHRTHPELGIRYNHIDNAVTTSGKVTNVAEAEAVALRVVGLLVHEYSKPVEKRLSIGVVTMNLYQQDCVLTLLQKYREENRAFDRAISELMSDKHEEPFFVRNLENIQGDQRDVMIISCTYGPQTPGGTPPQRFGPLNRAGGERRFNVLITRAKWRMEVYASMKSEQILPDGKHQGVRDFHLFLKYAETGLLPSPAESTYKSCDSPFEAQVEAVLQREGYQTERQVGVAGYFIDLAVKHPSMPGIFAIGIECDGRTYHSSPAARDRDRLREKLLLERGWRLHRIWSTDWFVSPIQAKQRLLESVRAATLAPSPEAR